ncbi:MAG: hypothetical protein ACXACB_06935, partial [Promethearchaeota archaeon]
MEEDPKDNPYKIKRAPVRLNSEEKTLKLIKESIDQLPNKTEEIDVKPKQYENQLKLIFRAMWVLYLIGLIIMLIFIQDDINVFIATPFLFLGILCGLVNLYYAEKHPRKQ